MNEIPSKLGPAFAGERTGFIAEIGTNHGARLEQAFELIDACAEAGADAVKFQSWKVSEFQNPLDPGEDRRWETPAAACEVLARYQLPDDWHPKLAERCRERDVEFLSTPFDPERAEFLAASGVNAIKIASGDLTYLDLLDTVAGLDLPVVLSTGMGDLEEIRSAVRRLNCGEGRLAILHCVADYPPQPTDANLRAVAALKEEFGTTVGWSDHFTEDTFAVASVALGATLIEKHVTLSRENDDPDAPFAVTPEEFGDLIGKIRRLESGLGDGAIRCAEGEANGRIYGRRSLYASRDLAAGDIIARGDIKVVRPALGEFFADQIDEVVGKTLAADLPAHHPFSRDGFAS